MSEVVDVTERVGDADIREVLKPLAWRGTPGELDEIASPYATRQARLFALVVDGRPVSCVGVWREPGGAELRTVATRADCQKRGHASDLIDRLMQRLDLNSVWAETDDDAVDFYRSAGFSIESLGEKYPGAIRYRCTRSRSASHGHV